MFADYLSRIKPDSRGTAYLDSEEDEEPQREVAAAESVKFQLLSLSLLRDLQANCPEIERIRKGDMPRNASFNDVEMDNKLIFCETSSNKGPRPYVPQELRSQLTQSLHFDHLGTKTTLKRVTSQYYWPSMKHDVPLFIKTCSPWMFC